MAFVACAGGSSLKRRIAAIMNHDGVRELSRSGKILLSSIGLACIAAPVVSGLASPRPWAAQEAQAVPGARFEVVSIKPNVSNANAIGMFPSPGRLSIRNYTLKQLVLDTYRLRAFQLVGAKGWMESSHWDIEAVYPAVAGKGAMQAGAERLPAMLEDYFHLATHREMRQMPIYTLIAGKAGPKLKPSQPNGKPGWWRELPLSQDPAGITTFNMDFRVFTNALSGLLDLPLVDKTGIAGLYDIELTFTDRHLLDAPDYAGRGISVFTALQEQLGLKLEASKGPVEVLVIDKAEKPDAN